MRKKNKTMRAAGALFLATMLTTSMTAGTFAKYTTGDSASDSARVAKFGVVAAVDGDLFSSSYNSVANGNSAQTWNTNARTVSSSGATVDVVAPGTKNDKGLALAVTGIPEVSTSISINAAKNASNKDYADSDIVLKQGTYGVMVAYTGTVTGDTVANYFVKDTDGNYTVASDPAATLYKLHDVTDTMSSDYYPIKWTLDVGGSTNVYNKTADVKDKLGTIFNITKNPNVDNALSAKITWEWDFDYFGAGTYDKEDTILGDMIAKQVDPTLTYDVVKLTDTVANKYATVKYAELNAKADNNAANNVIVAYTGSDVPATKDATSICSVLTVSFSARLTVTQED